MEVSPLLRRAIGPKTDASDLEQVARGEGMTTMTEDGRRQMPGRTDDHRRGLSRNGKFIGE